MKATIVYDDELPAYEVINKITLTNLCVHHEMLYKDEDPSLDDIKHALKIVIGYFQTPSDKENNHEPV